MTTAVVVSQPMLFPWVGIFEQIRLCDSFIHLDNVQFSRRSFTNRVQLKARNGPIWWTIPLPGNRFGDRIDEIHVDPGRGWRKSMLDAFKSRYRGAPHFDEAFAIASDTLNQEGTSLSRILISGIERCAAYFDLRPRLGFSRASQIAIEEGLHKTELILALVNSMNGSTYITGLGGKNYLDHARMESAGIGVCYMAYERTPYPQLEGPFDPHVSILDLIANQGKSGKVFIRSKAVPWRDAIEPHQ